MFVPLTTIAWTSMLILSRGKHYFLFFFCLYHMKDAKAQQGFVMNFQMVKNHSQLTTDAFAEFTGNTNTGWYPQYEINRLLFRQNCGNSVNVYGLLVVQHSVFQLKLQHCVAILLCQEGGRAADMHILW